MALRIQFCKQCNRLIVIHNHEGGAIIRDAMEVNRHESIGTIYQNIP